MSQEKLGAVIVFTEDVDLDEAAEILTDLMQRGKIEYRKTTWSHKFERYVNATAYDEIHSFNPEWGGPVWYIP